MNQSCPPVPGALSPTAAGLQTRTPAGAGDLTGCPWHDVKAKLREVGLRPTRQRMALGWILFAKGDRHVTAEMLYEEANHAKVPVSLATVYIGTSSPRSACCARSPSTGGKPISTPTIPSTITSSSKTATT